jgi:hypothetical protein
MAATGRKLGTVHSNRLQHKPMDTVTGGLKWHRSSYCSGANTTCVEVALEGAGEDVTVLVRDSKQLTGPVLHLSRDQWRVFLQAVASGEFR